MLILALAYGDDGIYTALQPEDTATKWAVITVVDNLILPRDKTAFPRTRSSVTASKRKTR